ncbi:hypothetical protein [Mesorhizobium sp.]|uniref:hypothetical protein n=1 Tax=Mesorhizobium sp. TaxID=1871066 RepID=UPI0012070ECF|nr:hypothetical protein [Mesorhizobium sp.]TIP14308.1 MAG: hypothetical protein E5X73_05330 [Mesorhizobium sp.]
MPRQVEIRLLGRFQDAYLKYQHAQKHFVELVGLINGLLQDKWWEPEKVEGAPQGTVRIRILRQPTHQWSLVLGDFIHNLRGCLDYATCGLVETADRTSDLKKVEFPFGRLGQPLNANDRGSIKGITPAGLEKLEAIRAEFGADLNFINTMSNQDKHRLLLPVAVHQVPMKLTIDEASNTASIDEDIAGAVDVWTRRVRDGDEIVMPHMLSMGIGVLIEGEPMPFPLKHIERVNHSVWAAFMALHHAAGNTD